jgi:hypothetical protein
MLEIFLNVCRGYPWKHWRNEVDMPDILGRFTLHFIRPVCPEITSAHLYKDFSHLASASHISPRMFIT